MASLAHRHRRKSPIPLMGLTVVLMISCSIIYVYHVVQFFSDNRPNQIAEVDSLSQRKARFISIMLKQDTILDIPHLDKVEKRSTAAADDDDDDNGNGKHRPYPFKVSANCPKKEMIQAIDHLREHRNQAKSRVISIRGERHSGTKLIRSLLNRNIKGIEEINNKLAKVNMTMDTIYGWKHGFFHDDFITQVNPMDVFLIVTRDPFSWVLSMFVNPYNMLFHANASDFGSFLTTAPYRSQNCEAPHFTRRCSFPMEQADNIIHLRTAKYKNWIRYPNISRSILRYEDVARDQAGTIIRILDQHKIPHEDMGDFRRAEHYIGFDGEKQEIYTPIVFREKYLAHFTIDEIQFVMANLDLDFEKRTLNYTYDEISAYIDDRLQGRKPYLGAPKLSDANIHARKAKIESYRLGILNLNEYDC